MSTSPNREVRPIVDAVCAQMGLTRWDANTVEMWVRQGPKTWAKCCGSNCDPCNGTLAQAARAVLRQLDAEDPAR